MIITRFAPSPTGNLHIGGVRTALINYIITQDAKKKFPNSKFYIRNLDYFLFLLIFKKTAAIPLLILGPIYLVLSPESVSTFIISACCL